MINGTEQPGKARIRHFHLPGIYAPAITFYITESKYSTKISWAICSADDNFSRKEGVKRAKQNMSHSVYVSGLTRPSNTLTEDILYLLENGHYPAALTDQHPRKDPQRFRKQAIRTLEEYYIAEDDVLDRAKAKPKKSLYHDRVLPVLFKAKAARKFFWGTD